MIFLAIGLCLGLLTFLLTRRPIPAAVTAVLTAVFAYISLPTLAWGYWSAILVLAPALIISIVVLTYERQKNGPSKVTRITLGAISLVIAAMVIVPFVTSTALGRSDQFHDLLTPVDTLNNSVDLPPFDPTQVRVVDQAMAVRLADKRLGEITALGSQVDVGTMRIQSVADELFWVAALDHRGFFKWLNNREGTPGYLMVSATNPSDVRLVTELDGAPFHLKYNGGSLFGDNIERHLYSNGYTRRGMTDPTFEINDEGRPFYTVTLFDNEIGFSGADATGVLTLDAQTGEIAEYGFENAPDWIDRIHPEEMILDQIGYWGRYPHGWWNPSDLDKLEPTSEAALVYGKDGRSYFYTGLGSYGSDEGAIGYMLVDTRTKDTRFFKQAGATEAAAMSAAESALPEKDFTASFPIPGNVNGAWTYVTPLKNAEGQIGAIALVNVADYRIVGVGENARIAERDYQRKLAARTGRLTTDAGVSRSEITGVVTRAAADIREGNTDYYLQISGSAGKVFIGGSSISPELPITTVGDSVSLAFDDTGSGISFIKGFDNLSLSIGQDQEQTR
ncbi:MAG TPA: hypothetical protein VFI91_08170 [Longimicrobiaceae bacterium]|nr:hypothetical protein [Longimicrobiaceae bacterium]